MANELAKELLAAQRMLTNLQSKKQYERRPAKRDELQALIEAQHEVIREIKKRIDEA